MDLPLAKERCSSERRVLITPPKHFFLQLKRTQIVKRPLQPQEIEIYGNSWPSDRISVYGPPFYPQKDDSLVDVPASLTLKKDLHHKGDRDVEYVLDSFMEHLGDIPSDSDRSKEKKIGHYITYLRCPVKKIWYRVNGHKIQTDAYFPTQMGYLYHYSQVES
jgi:hypothetical protein